MPTLFKAHKYAAVVAVGVGLLYGMPNVFFMLSLGADYRGIPLLQTPNEDSYRARIQEIIDGHGALGSPFVFEYKDELPLSPPTGEWLYALPSIIFGISPAVTLIASKFILPTILFLLIYALIFRLTGDTEWRGKLTAIGGGLLIVLGYDLVDYRTVLKYLMGAESPVAFLLWARPVNPILGAIFLFSFLLFVWAITENTKRRKSAVVGAAAFLALMFGSYFFSWGIALSALAALILLLLLRGEYKTAGVLALIVPLGVLLSSPYWFFSWRAAQSPWYEESVLRSGLFLTHYPILNKLLLVALLFFALALLCDFLLKKKKGIVFAWEPWHSFSLAFLLGGVWAYSQQLFTGRTIWPYHFVQYTIPLVCVTVVLILHHIIRAYSTLLWAISIGAAMTASLVFGVYTQVGTYAKVKPYYIRLQTHALLFSWLNRQKRDCVVLVNETSEEMAHLNTLIPAFTHCNRYASSELVSLAPPDRNINQYLALLRLRGVSGEDIEDYLRERRSEAVGYMYSNWQGLFGVKDFPDFRDELLTERLREFPALYRAFLTHDFRAELQKYKLDYILSDAPLPERIAAQFPELRSVFKSGGNIIYSFGYSAATKP